MSIYLLFILFSFPLISHAYIDPGTGSFFLQMLLAVIFGASLGVRVFWRKFIAIFKRTSKLEESRAGKKIDEADRKQGGA